MKTNRFFIVVFFLILSLSSSIVAEDFSNPNKVYQSAGISSENLTKVDADVRTLLYFTLTSNNRVINEIKPAVGNPVILTKNNQKYVSVFIKSQNPTVTQRDIESNGGSVSNIISDIVLAEIPISNLSEVIFDSEINRVEASKYQESLLDTSLQFINVDKVHQGIDLPKAYKGEGVVVGVLDSGIDWTHPAFSNENGNRILYLWDMSDDTNPPAEFSYGTEYTKADLDQQNSNQIDDNGHGTHVASTAAGNAGGEDYPLDGVAPEADIVFVKGFRAGSQGFATNDIVNGCDYIFKRAAQLGKPAVINLSLGSVTGNTGKSLYEESLSNLVEAGNLIVASAGNSGSSFIHLQYQMTGTSVQERSNTFWRVSDSSRGITHIFGYPQSEDYHVGVQVLDESFNSLFVSPYIEYDTERSGAVVINDDTVGTLTLSGKPSSVEPYLFNIQMQFSEDSGVKDYIFNLYTYGSAFFNAWIYNGSFSTDSNSEQNIFRETI